MNFIQDLKNKIASMAGGDFWNAQRGLSIALIFGGFGMLLDQLMTGGFTLTDFFGLHHEGIGLLLFISGVLVGITQLTKKH